MESEDQLSLLPTQFKKHSALVATSCDITLTQRKAFNGLLAIAADQLREDPSLHRYTVMLSDLTTLTGFDCSKSGQRLIRELKKLMLIQAHWNVLGKDRSEDYTEGTVLLADYTVQGNKLKFGFAPLVRERILRPRMYAPLKFSTIRLLERKHSVVLYELCTDYRKLARLELTIEDLRQVLGIQPGEYNRHALFEAKVMAPAVEELNLKSELTVRYKYVERGRSVVGVVFNIKEEPEKLALQGESTRATDQRELLTLLPEALRGDKKLLLLIKSRYMQDGYDYVASNIAFVVKKAKTNPGKMLMMALEDDFAREDREKAAKKNAPKAPGSKKDKTADTSPEVTQKEKYLKYFKQLAEKEQQEIRDEIQRIREKGLSQAAMLMGSENDKIYGYLLNIRRIML